MLKFSTVQKEEHLDVSLIGDLDIDGTEIINEELLPVLLKFQSVNINLEEVPFVDSSGMGLLMNLVKTLKDKEKKITISDVREDVLEVFELLQLPEILGKEVFI